MALNNCLWSVEEEALLARILSVSGVRTAGAPPLAMLFSPQTDPGHLETFQKLLADNPGVFNHCRTATSLHHHWVLMGHYCLLQDQNGELPLSPAITSSSFSFSLLHLFVLLVDVIPPGDSVVNFTDAEDLINDAELM